MEIVNKAIYQIRPYENNPRHNEQAIEKCVNSIKEFGWQQPIVIDEDGVIICGHTRYEAAKYLGYAEVPCKVATELNDEQVKAYRLADNKVAELAEWDISALVEEIEGIEELDMSLFGFEFKLDEKGGSGGSDEDDEDEEPDYNESGGQLLMFHDAIRTEGWFEMPLIESTAGVPTPTDLIGFNYVLSTDRRDCGVHFYLDDYQFERIWNNPKAYFPKLAEFECVLTPDFSLFLEMSMSAKIWNTYRSRLIGQMMQDYGIKVIPTISWAEPETFKFCFDGIEEGSTVSISTIGVKRFEENRGYFDDGVKAMLEKIKPQKVLLYGGEVDFDWGDTEIITYDNHITEKWR